MTGKVRITFRGDDESGWTATLSWTENGNVTYYVHGRGETIDAARSAAIEAFRRIPEPEEHDIA